MEDKKMSKETLHIGIILGSTRKGRNSEQVGKWVQGHAEERDELTTELLDLREYDLPFLGTTEEGDPNVARWVEKIKELDGYIFITPEYNHGIPGVLKNAIDTAPRNVYNNKVAGIVSYGSAGGARSTEHLRGVLAELSVADVRTHTVLSLFTDFEKFSTFKPADLHLKNVNGMLDELIKWGFAMKDVREN